MKLFSQNPTSSVSTSSSSSTIIIAFFLIIVLSCFYNKNGAAAVNLPKDQHVPAIFAFGDSIVDPGNNNNIKTIIKCNFPPYGRDFMGKTPTGRFCNGLIPTDFIAQEFGVKKLLPAYLDPNLQAQDLVTGVSFASGGTGYDPLTPKIASVIPLPDQLGMFKEALEKINGTVGEAATANILSKGLFVVVSGSDDIANTYFSTPFRRAHFDINSYTDLTATSASTFLQELYEVGARKIGVLGVPPIGCVPVQRTLNGGVARGCSDSANQAAQIFNSKLESVMDSLGKKFPDGRFIYFDSYNPLLSLIQNPAKYGIEVVNKGCCGTGNVEVSILCNQLEDADTCKDASKFVFWDSYHPTEAAYKIITPQIVAQRWEKLF